MCGDGTADVRGLDRTLERGFGGLEYSRLWVGMRTYTTPHGPHHTDTHRHSTVSMRRLSHSQRHVRAIGCVPRKPERAHAGITHGGHRLTTHACMRPLALLLVLPGRGRRPDLVRMHAHLARIHELGQLLHDAKLRGSPLEALDNLAQGGLHHT